MIKSRVSLVISVSLLLALGLGVTANAQYLISAKAGFVNRVEGEVHILRADGADGEKARASLGTQMRVGDRLSVAADGFAEALLNPGSYLRLRENTEVRAVSVDLDSVRIEVINGSAIVEVGQVNKKSPIEIITPHGSLTIARAGLLRIDTKESATLVSVRQGEVHLGTRGDFEAEASVKIKSGKVVTLIASAQLDQLAVAKLNKDTIDKLDTWSFNRAQALTEANVRALSRSRSGVLTAGWHYDPFFNAYTFVPYRSWFWSPYGFGFFNNYRDCHGYNPYYSSGFSRSNSGSSGGVSVSPRVVGGHNRREVIFRTDRRSNDAGVDSPSGRFGEFRPSRGGASSSPPSTSPQRSTPAPTRSRGDSGHRGER
ncbi:MAG: FecR domain-containing protein, partial [Blastocatellia bacterium]